MSSGPTDDRNAQDAAVAKCFRHGDTQSSTPPRFEQPPQGTLQKGYQSVVWTAHDENDDECATRFTFAVKTNTSGNY